MKKLVISVFTALNAGCASMEQSATPNYDKKFGDAVREAKYNMTINPDAGEIPDQVAGVDGVAGKNTIDRYQDTFKEPPPVVPVINIGGSFSGGGEGSKARLPDSRGRDMRSVNREKGAVIVTAAMTLLFILGFMAIALDFGHLFVVKTELQTATDSCALAAAQELGGGSDALARATNAGKTVGNLNKVNFQGASTGFVDSDITFSSSLTGSYSRTEPAVTAKYAMCTRTRSGMAPWLLQTMGAFTGNASYKGNQGVWAFAVAARTSAQSVCNALPVQIRPKTAGAGAPNYGYTPGEWIPSLYNENQNNNAPTNGEFGWGNLDGSPAASETKAEVLGNAPCNLRVGSPIYTPGAKVAASTEWNSRFGLYVNGNGNPKITDAAPDTTGYSYTPTNWPSKFNAVGNFLAKRAAFRSFGDTTDTVSAGNTITGLSLNNNYKDNLMGTFSTNPNRLSTYGRSRRLVIAPIVTGTTVTDWACVLMLHPIDGPNVTVYLEYIGNAGALNSPCANAGLAGGTSGPLVPALVQ